MPLLCGPESCTLLPSIILTPGRSIKYTEAEQVRLPGEDVITNVLSLNWLGNIVPESFFLLANSLEKRLKKKKNHILVIIYI